MASQRPNTPNSNPITPMFYPYTPLFYGYRPPLGPVLNATPINSTPYIHPIPPPGFDIPSEPVNVAKPALVYLPSQPTDVERDQILNVTRGGVVLTGSAAVGEVGPVVGKMDISENEDTYLFRVSMPGVPREGFTCDVSPDGKIHLKGITTTGEKIVYRNSMRFEMQSQNLCPPGHFTITFQLPGPVDSKSLLPYFGNDGILEGIVKKTKRSTYMHL